ncbi:MAG TPA: ADP-ribosylation/crystallin J1 [Mycobacteriales bacterium]|nr:ADP-ribosylation/crystallin J1 [Mycobacteriales bacterium]
MTITLNGDRVTRQREGISGVSSEETVVLWRPTGPNELRLVEESGWRRWPPRLPEQPIFYPVLSEEYATKIARDWNVKASGAGYVTRFRVRRAFLDRYEVHQVGGRDILEYWIPAEDLDEFNDNIVGEIELVSTFATGTH